MDEETLDALLRKTKFRPSPAQTERFVLQVMAALPSPVVETVSWLSQPWFAPAFGLSFAALLVSLMPFPVAAEDEAALLLDPSGWSQPTPPTTPDEVLGLLLESR